MSLWHTIRSLIRLRAGADDLRRRADQASLETHTRVRDTHDAAIGVFSAVRSDVKRVNKTIGRAERVQVLLDEITNMTRHGEKGQ